MLVSEGILVFKTRVCVCAHVSTYITCVNVHNMCQHAYASTHALTLARAHTYIGRQPSRLDKECLRKLYEFHKQLKAYIAAEEVKLERRHSHAVSFVVCVCVCVCACVCVHPPRAILLLCVCLCVPQLCVCVCTSAMRHVLCRLQHACVCARACLFSHGSLSLPLSLSRSLARVLFAALTLST